jgi:hypothetical protein
MRSYHFSIGNSSEGPIGFCARVLADSEAEAVQVLKDALESVDIQCEHAVYDDCVDSKDDRPVDGLEYIRVYFNPEVITASDIDDSEERCPCCEGGVDEGEVESTYCGSMCQECREKHAEECEVCASDFAERGI